MLNGLDSVRELEAIGVLEAMYWVCSLGLHYAEFEKDDLMVSNDINNPSHDVSEFGLTIDQCSPVLLLERKSFPISVGKRT